jgi:hypothetical protein
MQVLPIKKIKSKMPPFNDKKNIYYALFFISVSFLIKFFGSLMFNQGSLSYFVFFILITASLSYFIFLFLYFKSRAIFIFLASLMCIASLGVMLEIGGQLYGFLHPSYFNLALKPDPVLGWRFLPKTQYKYTQKHWYAREFSTTVKINSHGFRDLERKLQKSSNTIRIALLGDSLIAAREVEFGKTAAQLLEKKLNREFGKWTGKKFEVLNFGVSGYGLDQIYLNWINFAAKFQPDYVFVNLFDKNYMRSISSTWCQVGMMGLYNLKQSECLHIRPFANLKKQAPQNLKREEKDNFILDYIFINKTHLDKLDVLSKSMRSFQAISYLGNLPLSVYLPSDYEEFVEKQNLFIERKLDGKRMKKITPNSFVFDIFSSVKVGVNSLLKEPELESNHGKDIRYVGDKENFPTWLTTNMVNLKILQALGNMVKQSGGKFIIIDSFKSFENNDSAMRFSSHWLKKLSQFSGFNYIPFYKTLENFKNEGAPVFWKHDPHLNEKGNEVFADEMFNYFQKDLLDKPMDLNMSTNSLRRIAFLNEGKD